MWSQAASVALAYAFSTAGVRPANPIRACKRCAAGAFSMRARQAFGRHIKGGCLNAVRRVRSYGRARTNVRAKCCPGRRGRARSGTVSRMHSKLMRGHVTFKDTSSLETGSLTGAAEADGDTWRPVRAHNAVKLAVEQRLASHDPLLISGTAEGHRASMRDSVLSTAQHPGASSLSPAPSGVALNDAQAMSAAAHALVGASSQQLQQHLVSMSDLRRVSSMQPAMLPTPLQLQQRSQESMRHLHRSRFSDVESTLSSRTVSPHSTIQTMPVRSIHTLHVLSLRRACSAVRCTTCDTAC